PAAGSTSHKVVRMDTNRPESVIEAQLYVERSVGDEVFVAAATQWFVEGFATLGGSLRHRLLARAVPPGEVPGDKRLRGESGEVWWECSWGFDPRGEWHGYTDFVWRKLIGVLAHVPQFAVFGVYELERLNERVVRPWFPRVRIRADSSYPDSDWF